MTGGTGKVRSIIKHNRMLLFAVYYVHPDRVFYVKHVFSKRAPPDFELRSVPEQLALLVLFRKHMSAEEKYELGREHADELLQLAELVGGLPLELKRKIRYFEEEATKILLRRRTL